MSEQPPVRLAVAAQLELGKRSIVCQFETLDILFSLYLTEIPTSSLNTHIKIGCKNTEPSCYLPRILCMKTWLTSGRLRESHIEKRSD